MFAPVSDRAHQAILAAKTQAETLGWLFAGPINLLWAVAGEDAGVAHAALLEARVDPGALRAEIEKRAASLPPTERPTSGSLPRVMMFAMLEAKGSGSDHLDSQHILLGVLREPTGTLAAICKQANLSTETTRAALKRLFPGN